MKLSISLLVICIFLLSGSLFFKSPDKGPLHHFSEKELASVYSLTGLEGLKMQGDKHLLQNEKAVAFGKDLFFEIRLSANKKISCATCHDPQKSWTDGSPLAQGLSQTKRHTPSLWNISYNRWFFWDGRADSPWSQALLPIESEHEMGSNRNTVVRLIAEDELLRKKYEVVFGKIGDFSDLEKFPTEASPLGNESQRTAWAGMEQANQEKVNQVFSNLGKAIAAFESKIISKDSPFDRFVKNYKKGVFSEQPVLSAAAINGLRIFVGKGNCVSCHAGPNLTDNEFHNIRLKQDPYNLDPGRYDGIDFVKTFEFNGLSKYSDDPKKAVVKYLNKIPRTWGEFKTPSLRNVSLTAPYMHDGRFESLEEVLHHYSTFENAAPPDHHAESILQALHFSKQEINDLIAFLKTLEDDKKLE